MNRVSKNETWDEEQKQQRCCSGDSHAVLVLLVFSSSLGYNDVTHITQTEVTLYTLAAAALYLSYQDSLHGYTAHRVSSQQLGNVQTLF